MWLNLANQVVGYLTLTKLQFHKVLKGKTYEVFVVQLQLSVEK